MLPLTLTSDLFTTLDWIHRIGSEHWYSYNIRTEVMSQTTPAIFRLPLELRQQIYSYLLPRENVSHPLPSVGITSVSHRPPTAALLNIHPIIADEIMD